MAERPLAGHKHSRSPGSTDDVRSHKAKRSKDVKKHKVILVPTDFKRMPREELLAKWKEQDAYIEWIESSCGVDTMQRLRDSETKLQQQLQESVKRENILNMKLATKHQEMQDLLTQIHDLKQAQSQNTVNLHSMALDPAVNLVFQKMKSELQSTKEQLEQAQSDLSAWKFTPDSVTGKKLMSKCRALIHENQELGKQLSQGRIAQLEAEIALQKKYSMELKGLQDELSEYAVQVDEEAEGMYGLVVHLKQRVRELEEQLKSVKSSQKMRSKCIGPDDSFPDEMK